MTHREPRVYSPLDQPDVEVLWQGEDGTETWCPGELRMWTPVGDDEWEGNVAYRRPGSITSHLGTFPAERIRLDTVDRSKGRTV